MTRRELIASLSGGPLLAGGLFAPAIHLIAHRGGVVGEGRAENSEGALREAVRHNYWMVEIDLRPTSDGHLVLQHDATLQKRFGDPRTVESLTLAEARALRGKDGDRLMTLEQACTIAKGRTRFMLDGKGEKWPEAAYGLLSRTLEANGLLDSCWVLGGESIKARLEGRAGLSIGRVELQKTLDNGEPTQGLYLFELGSAMNEDSIAMARSVDIPAVAAINIFRYTMARVDEDKGAAADIARLRALGVSYYQIDSRYEPLFSQ